MMSLWASLEDSTASVIDGVFHERVRVTPMASNDYDRTEDPSRPSFDAMFGVQVLDLRKRDLDMVGSIRDGLSITGLSICLWANLVTAPAAADLRVGDQVVLRDRGDAHYEIASVERGQRNRLGFHLSAL